MKKRHTTTNLKLDQIKTPPSKLFEPIPDDTKQAIREEALDLLNKLIKSHHSGCVLFTLTSTPSTSNDYILMALTMDSALYNAEQLGIAVPLLMADVNTDLIPDDELKKATAVLSRGFF